MRVSLAHAARLARPRERRATRCTRAAVRPTRTPHAHRCLGSPLLTTATAGPPQPRHPFPTPKHPQRPMPRPPGLSIGQGRPCCPAGPQEWPLCSFPPRTIRQQGDRKWWESKPKVIPKVNLPLPSAPRPHPPSCPRVNSPIPSDSTKGDPKVTLRKPKGSARVTAGSPPGNRVPALSGRLSATFRGPQGTLSTTSGSQPAPFRSAFGSILPQLFCPTGVLRGSSWYSTVRTGT